MKLIRRALWLLVLLLPAAPALAAIEVSVQPNPALAGEIFELRIVQSPAAGGEPRLGPLPPGVREVQRQQSQSYQLINGRRSSTNTWTIAMLATEPGDYTLPAASMGSEPIPPIPFSIRAPDPSAQAAAEIFAQFRASTETTWVGAEISLHMQVYIAGELDSGSLPDPVAEGLVIEKIAESNDGDELIGNTRYRVLDRRYVAFAERSGPLRITGPVFRGQVVDRSRRNRFPSFSLPTRRVQTVVPDVEIEVLPTQPRAGASWLPARKVRLSESLDLGQQPAEQNQAFTRTIQLLVDGQLHTQLPALRWPEPDRAQSQTYAEPEQSHTQALGDGVRATVVQRFVHIPQQDRIALPAIRLPWFNTRTGAWEVAELPAREIPVRPARRAPPVTPDPTSDPSALAPVPPVPATATAAPPGDSGPWRALALASSAGWLATLMAWWWLGRRAARSAPQPEPDPAGQARRADVLRALARNQAGPAEKALLDWGRNVGLLTPATRPQGLLGLAAACADPALAAQLRALSAHRYGGGEYDAAALHAAFKAYRPPRPKRPPAPAALPALYPRQG